MIFACAFSAPLQAANENSSSHSRKDIMPYYASAEEQRYASVKAQLEAADKVPSVKESLLSGLKSAVGFLHKRTPQRGDPKTTFSQSENRMHSPRHTPPPPPPPLEPDPAPAPTPDPVPAPSPEPKPTPEPAPSLLDLTQWTVANQYLSGTYELSVYFKQAEDGLYDVVLVVYDTVTGQVLHATGYRTETVYTLPDRTGLTLVITSTNEDGSRMEKYALFTAENQSWNDVKMWVEIFYGSTGAFLSATIKTIEELELDTLVLPPLESIQQ